MISSEVAAGLIVPVGGAFEADDCEEDLALGADLAVAGKSAAMPRGSA